MIHNLLEDKNVHPKSSKHSYNCTNPFFFLGITVQRWVEDTSRGIKRIRLVEKERGGGVENFSKIKKKISIF